MINSKAHTLGRLVGESLLREGLVLFSKNPELLCTKIESFLNAAYEIEANLNTEAKALLEKYGRDLDKSQVDEHQMFLMIKKKLIRERDLVLQSDPTLSADDKISHLAHLIQLGIRKDPECDTKNENALLAEVKRILTIEMQQEESIQIEVRKRLSHYKKTVLEGTPEWDILYQRTVSELMRKKGLDSA
ncbi:MAG: DUF507 family protein [Nitrospirota bacterium]